MNNSKSIIYIIEIALMILLLLSIIFNNIFTKVTIAIVLLVFMVISKKTIKSGKLDSINNKQITMVMTSIVGIYMILIYIIGIKSGFYNASVKLSLWSLINYILPYIVIIISSEIIRKVIISKKNKKANIIILIEMILLETILSTNLGALKSPNDYFTLVCFILFSAVANNLLYNYIIKNYGNIKAIIIYRMILTLYIYIIPIIPNINILFESILRLILPYIIYTILDSLYAKERKVLTIKDKRRAIIISLVLYIIVGSIIMLISCKFRYGILVIGSGSMTGTINKGDFVVYENYKPEKTNIEIKKGDVIVFTKEDLKVVHRVINIRNAGNETRYYTKGDANQQADDDYIEKKDIMGIVKFKIQYIGNLTLWLNELIS